MEEEEARLKALLEQTEDFDERRKIRAELRTVRKKMLESLSATAEAESHERATRRAERARARKAEEVSNHTGPVISDKVLAEIDDEATLQQLLDEIPTSQIEDRRRLRARIREVKRKKTEDSEPAPRRTRRTRETTETSEESSTRDKRYRKTASEESIETKSDSHSSVTMETSSDGGSSVTVEAIPDDASSVTIETKSEEQPAVTIPSKTEEPSEITSDEPASVTMETNSEDTSVVSIETSTDTVTIETISATTGHGDDDNEIKFKLTLRQSNICIEEDAETNVEQSSSVDVDRAVEVPNEEPSGTSVEVNIEHRLDKDRVEDRQNFEEIETSEAVLEDKKAEELPAEEEVKEIEEKPLEAVNDQISTEDGNGVSMELRIDEEVNLNINTDNENQHHANEDSKKPSSVEDTPDGGKILKEKKIETKASKDSTSESKPSKASPASRRPPPDDDKKKHGRVNQVDFRTNLKKSGKIGQGVVNLEKKNSTTGAQVDFRNLKKSGRIGSGTVNLENKVSTQGAQIDFRSSSLKPSGKIGGTGVVHLERKTTTTGAQVDFRAALKKEEKSPSVKTPASSEGKGSLKSKSVEKKVEENKKTEQPEESKQSEIEHKDVSAAEDKLPSDNEVKEDSPALKEVTIPTVVEKKVPFKKEPRPVPAKKEKSSEIQNDSEAKKEDIHAPDEKETKNEKSPDIKLDVKVDHAIPSLAPSVNDTTKEDITTSVLKDKQLPEEKAKIETKYKPRDSYKTREDTKVAVSGGKNKLFQKMSKFQAKDETAVRPKVSAPGSRAQKKEPTPDKAINGLAAKVDNTSLAAKEPEPAVQIEVTEHVEEDGDTHTEVREEKTTKQDGDIVEEKKEVTTTTKTTTPTGGKFTFQTKETTTKTTAKKTFIDPEMQKRMAARHKERVTAKREQASSAKNKRMAFMQKLEANSPAQKGPTNIKRSGSNVDKLLAWCRFKLRDYEGVKLTNFSSSWADGLAFCALLHLYLPDKIPYKELFAGGDKRRNFEVAFGAATEAGVPELLEVDDMLSVANPEPKSVMTYVSSIYKHFNPS